MCSQVRKLEQIRVDERQLACAHQLLDPCPGSFHLVEMFLVQRRADRRAEIALERATPSYEEPRRLRRRRARVAVVQREIEARAQPEERLFRQVETLRAQRVPHRGRAAVKTLAVHRPSSL